MNSDRYDLWGAPSQEHRASEDEPWDFSAFHGNPGSNCGIFYGVVEYDFAFIPDRRGLDQTGPDLPRVRDREPPRFHVDETPSD